MSRARNIKPGFFKNEVLVELPFEHRLLFIGLWTMADREGRLEDRPTKIKMEIFPADSVDVNAGLQALHDNGFILRYAIDGKALVQILAWGKHQNPHIKEAKSTIQAPGEHGASTVLATTKAVASPADSLIPDSLIPLPKARAIAGASSAKRGTRLRPDWGPSPDDIAFATSEGVNWAAEADKFRDYWIAKSGAAAVKLDWPATWRNWIRSARRAPITNGGRPNAAANFRGKVYEGTKYEDLPANLRPENVD